jgi:hypothetical protein
LLLGEKAQPEPIWNHACVPLCLLPAEVRTSGSMTISSAYGIQARSRQRR